MVSRILNSLLALLLVVLLWSVPPAAIAAESPPTETVPEVSQPSVLDLFQELNELSSQALKATNEGDFPTAETYWTKLIERFPDNPAAWSNRGNAKVSQNKLESALADYQKAIELAPQAPDPYLNRGTALEGLGRW
ncbi:MAG TPA: tetratricopeptide repeat protein, partial [Microcoleaceae cyanobacterium]